MLASGRWARPQPASLPNLGHRDDFAAALRKICVTCLRDLMVNEVAITGPDPVEGVHKTRIAVRRLRSAMSLFSPVLKKQQTEEVVRELKWLSDVLGRVRDLDVIVEKSGGWADLGLRAVPLLSERLTADRLKARDQLGEALKSRRWRSFLFSFVRWLEIGGWKRGPTKFAQMPIEQLAQKLLAKRLDKLLQDTRGLANLSTEDLHEIRKDAKRLRYMAEFFLSLIDHQRHEGYGRLLEGLEDIQKALGHLQDQVTLANLLRSQIQDDDDDKTREDLKSALKYILAGSATGEGTARKQARRAIRKIRASKPFSSFKDRRQTFSGSVGTSRSRKPPADHIRA
jgi:CHAD domain-containing protein